MYEITAYYDKYYRGIATSETAQTRDKMIEIVHTLAGQGYYIEVEKPAESLRFDPDTYEREYFYEGEVNLPIS